MSSHRTSSRERRDKRRQGPKMVEAGQPLKVGGLELSVLSELSSSKDRRSYLVKDQNGVRYVYKYQKRRSVKREVGRTSQLSTHGIPHAEMVASGPDFTLRQWVEGMSGEAWLKVWESFGAPINTIDGNAVDSLMSLLDIAAKAGIYIGSLSPSALVVNGSQWKIVDCGNIRTLSPVEAASRYFWRMLARWGKVFDKTRTAPSGQRALSNLLTALSGLGKNYPVELKAPLVALQKTVSVPPDSSDSDLDDEDDDDSGPLSGDEDEDDDSGDSLPPSVLPEMVVSAAGTPYQMESAVSDDVTDVPQRHELGFVGGRVERSSSIQSLDIESAYPKQDESVSGEPISMIQDELHDNSDAGRDEVDSVPPVDPGSTL